MGSNIVTGGLGGLVGTALVIVMFFIIPGRQKLVFLALWLSPVILSAAFDFKLGVYLWGLLGFWVSLILTPYVSEVLGVQGKAENGSDAENKTSPNETAKRPISQEPSARVASLNSSGEENLIGGVMTLREAHTRVCRAHDEQTTKLKLAIEELESLRRAHSTLKMQHTRAEEALQTAQQENGDLQRQLSDIAAEVSLLKSMPFRVDQSLDSLKQQLCDLDAAITATPPHDYATIEGLKTLRAKLVGGVYRLHLLAKGTPVAPSPRADYSAGTTEDFKQADASLPAPEELMGVLKWPRSVT